MYARGLQKGVVNMSAKDDLARNKQPFGFIFALPAFSFLSHTLALLSSLVVDVECGAQVGHGDP